AFRRGDGADRTNKSVTQTLQWHFFAGENILQIERLVRAFDNLRGAIVTANPFHKHVVGFPCTFRDKDVTGASKISRRLTQRATRKKKFIAERRLPIHKHDVQPMFEMEILQAVVEQKGIDFPLSMASRPLLTRSLSTRTITFFKLCASMYGSSPAVRESSKSEVPSETVRGGSGFLL